MHAHPRMVSCHWRAALFLFIFAANVHPNEGSNEVTSTEAFEDKPETHTNTSLAQDCAASMRQCMQLTNTIQLREANVQKHAVDQHDQKQEDAAANEKEKEKEQPVVQPTAAKEKEKEQPDVQPTAAKEKEKEQPDVQPTSKSQGHAAQQQQQNNEKPTAPKPTAADDWRVSIFACIHAFMKLTIMVHNSHNTAFACGFTQTHTSIKMQMQLLMCLETDST